MTDSDRGRAVSGRGEAARRMVRPLLVAHGVAALVIGLAWLGGLQSWDLRLHDLGVRLWSGQDAGRPAPVLLVGASEADLNRFGWPLPDGVLARALDRLAAAGPRAVGVDLYRDRPRPPGAEALDAALQRHEQVVVVYAPALEGGTPGIPPPAILRGTDRVGFADVVVDPDGTVRRGLLFLSDGTANHVSFALNLAVRFLAAEGVRMRPDPDRPAVLRLGATALPPLGPRFGGYGGVDAAGYQVLMDFRDAPDAIPMVTLGDLLGGAVAPERIADRVVILGVAAQSVKDTFVTPLDHDRGGAGQTAGIALHGQLVGQLVRLGRGTAPPYRAPGPLGEAAWTWLWAMLGALAGHLTRGWLRFALVVGAGAATVSGLGVLASGAFWWLPAAAPTLAWGATAALVTAWRAQRERADRTALMRLFAVNVSPRVADALWAERDRFMVQGRPLPRDLTATVLFTDIRGFTTIAETLPAGVLMDWLNRYMDAMVDVINRNGGVVDKFIGDAIMAVFGVPVPRTTPDAVAADARAAVACAQAFGPALATLNRTFAADGLPTVAMRVGINTGPVVAGGLGGRARMNYTVLGDTVNVAARLESFDKTLAGDRDCRVLIAERTRVLVGDAVEAHPVGALALKGRHDRVRVFLVGAAPTADAVVVPAGTAPMAGEGTRQ